jgi:hypothetical protein
LLLKKPNLYRVSTWLGKSASDPGAARHNFIVFPEGRDWLQFPKENGFVGRVVNHSDVTGILAGAVTRKNQKKPDSRRNKGKDVAHEPVAQSFQVEYASFCPAFPNAIADRQEPYTRRKNRGGHKELQAPLTTNAISP